MADSAQTPATASLDSTSPMADLRKGLLGDAGVSQNVTIPDHPSGDEDARFYTWPTMPAQLPADILEKVTKHRDAIANVAAPFKNKSTGFYSSLGKDMPPDPLLDGNDEKQYPDPAAKAGLVRVLKRLSVELGGEGGVSSIMTGDSAKFTWGHGLTRSLLAKALKRLFKADPDAQNKFLECGVSASGNDLVIVKVDSGGYVTGEAALDLFIGESLELKEKLLSIFITLTEAHLKPSADAQWLTWKEFLYSGKNKPPSEIMASSAWTPEVICYVVHCAGWGSFAGWDAFQKTGGDLKKVLRTEADATYNVKHDGYMLVPTDWPNSQVKPSTSMLFNFGHGIIVSQKVLEACADPASKPAPVTNGDAVFEIHKIHRSKYGGSSFAVLPNVPRQYGGLPSEEAKMAAWFEKHHSMPMDYLLKACSDLGYAKLLKYRNWYGYLEPDPTDPTMPAEKKRKIAPNEKWGLRPRVAMDAVLHAGEGEGAHWVLSEAEMAKITPDNCSDQYDMLKHKLGIA